MGERRERIMERECEGQNGRQRQEEKDRGEGRGIEWERNREERRGAQTNTVSLGHSPGFTVEHRDNKH